MRFTNPAGLWLAALAIPVVLLHVLRPRRPPVEVSSTYLWRELADPVSVASPWQRLKPSVLLVLQLLAVLLLAVAAARPVRVTEAPLARHSVFIVDASGSMAAEDGRPDRLGAAVNRALDLRAQLPAGGVASVVVADSQPRVVLSSSPDRQAFDEAVGAIRTTPGAADFATAFTLAESLETPGEPVGFILLSDGGLTDVEKGLLPPGTRYVRTGSQATNRAVSRLTVEPRGSGLHARASVRNTGGPSSTQTLRLDVDGRTAHSERIVLDAGAAVEREIDLPSGDRIEAFLEGEDLLAADNRAVAVAGHRRALRVLWAGPDDVFLERLLAVLPSLVVERTPDSRPAPGFDLAIYAGVAVPADPGVPYLAIAPTGGAPGVGVTGEVQTPAVTLVRTTNQLLAGLDLSDVAVAKAQKLEAPGDEVLVGSEATPLLVRGNRQGTPFAYLGFTLSQSNLPVQVAFPVLADRLLTDLTGSGAPPSDLRVGQTLPLALAEGATIEAPGGARLTVPPGGAAPVLDRVGFWTITRPNAGAAPVTVAVNADPAESTLAPAGSLPAPARPAAPGERKPAGERSLLTWVAAVLAGLLAAEFILSRRRRGVARRQWAMAMAARVAVGVLLVAAVAGLSVPRPGRHVAVVFLVDGSDSLGAAGRTEAVEWTRQALSHQPKGAEAGVAVFGGDARLELTVQSRARLLQPSVRIDSSRTNLAGALRLASAVLPSDARRRIVVVSDGKATEGDAAAEARRLREAGIEVDVHLVESSSGPDVAVDRVDAPSTVRQGEAYTVRATIQSSQAQTVRLRWERDGRVVDERLVDVHAGTTVVDLPQVATEAGSLARYHLTVSAADDAVAENDVGDAAVATEGPPRVLLVEGMPAQGATLAGALRAGGIPTDVIAATDVPPLDRLAGYSATVLVDVDARALVADQVAALAAASRDLGRGLVVVGGDRSFALGGYLGSELEKVLPVVSDVTDPKRRPSVAQVLAIDSSGSMGACHCAEGGANGLVVGNSAGGVNKTDISRAAAARTIAALSNNDQVGVLAFNTAHNWVVPLQQLPPEDVVTKGLSGLSPAGGTNLALPLKEAGDALRKAKAGLKHIILFTDGFTSHGGLDTLADQAAALAAEGITVSVLATGETGARDNLAHVAEAGRGRFYNEVDLSQVPQLMMQEAVLASRQLVNEGEYYPKVTSSAPAVRDLRQSPPLLGFLVTTAKPSAQTHLAIGEEDDPLLATWQIGLGKVTAWTSDAGNRWSQQWASWAGFRDFWAAVVKDTFPLSGASGAGVRVTVDGSRVRIVAESAEPWPDGATASARLTGPDLVGRDVPLERVSGTTFVGEAPATAAGTYAAGVSVTGPGGALLSATATGVQAYSAEYRPGPADPDALARVSQLSGGRGAIAPEQAFASEGLRAGRGSIPLAGWFLLAAALLWPVAVALSRVALHGAAVAALRSGRGRVVEAVRRRLPRVGSPSAPLPPRTSSQPPGERPRRPAKAPATVAAPPPTIDRLLKRKRGEPDDPP